MVEKVKITNGIDNILIDFMDLENVSGYGDYLYYNNQNFCLGFSWGLKSNVFFDNVYFLVNNSNGEIEKQEFLENIEKKEKYTILLTKEDFEKFLKWFELCNN